MGLGYDVVLRVGGRQIPWKQDSDFDWQRFQNTQRLVVFFAATEQTHAVKFCACAERVLEKSLG